VIDLAMPSPKGKVKTVKELDQEKGGTQPTDFEADRKTLLTMMEQFIAQETSYQFARHPAFGSLSREKWGKLAYLHLDHHLRQFGV